MSKLLVAGIDSMIGANFALALSNRFECLGLYGEYPVSPVGCQSTHCNLHEAAEVLSALRDYAPTWLIYCSAASASAWEPAPAERLLASEIDLLRQLAETTSRLGCRLTVISSDAVFVGPRLFHEESCPPTGKTVQAQHARQMEMALKSTHALVVRTHVYGWSPSEARGSLVQTWVRQLLDGRSVSLDGLRYATPILASDLAELLAKAFELKLEGLYHLTGAERTNPYRFLGELASALEIESFRQAAEEFPFAASLVSVLETSLNTRRARRDLGTAMPLLREGLERFAAQRLNGYLDALRAGTHEPISPAKAA